MSSITYNGLDFSDSTVNFILTRDSFSQPADPLYNEYVTRSRTILQNNAWAPQIITVNGVIVGTSFADKMSKYRKLLGYLYASTAQPLIFSTEPTIQYNCKLASAPSASTVSDIAMEIEIEFISEAPGEDTSDTTVNGTVGDLVCSTVNSNYITYPTIDFTGLTPGATITVSTPSSEDSMQIQSYDATTMTITSTPGNKLVASGVTSKMAFLADASTFPRLLAFNSTQVVRVAVTAGSATTSVTYRNSYL